MSLMFTSRLGWTTSDFIRASRSVPPARTSAASQVVPSSSTACSFVCGDAYSKARMSASLIQIPIVKRLEHPIRGKGQERYPRANRIRDGVRDRCTGRDHGRLAQPDHTFLVVTFTRHHVNDKLGNVTDAG